MMPTDTSEKGLESIIVASLVEDAGYIQGNPQELRPGSHGRSNNGHSGLSLAIRIFHVHARKIHYLKSRMQGLRIFVRRRRAEQHFPMILMN
jgi:hypothetical protein